MIFAEFALRLHGFITETADGWQLRAPIFEKWLRKHAKVRYLELQKQGKIGVQ